MVVQKLGGGKPGRIKLNRGKHVAGGPSNMGGASEFNIWGTICFEGNIQIGTACKLVVGKSGTLAFGDGCKIMSHCHITAYKSVVIGRNLLMAHNAQIFDTNYHFVLDIIHRKINHIATPIHIGDNCWICNSSSILGGVTIPDDCIIASDSLVNKRLGEIPSTSIVSGRPAQLVKVGCRRVFDFEDLYKEADRYFCDHPDSAEFLLGS